jgi:hypothetical protein
MEDLDIVPVGSGGGAGIILRIADVHCRDDTATGSIDGVHGFCTQAYGVTAVLAARGVGGGMSIGNAIGLGLLPGRGRKEIGEVGIDDRIEQAFAVGAFIIQLCIFSLVDGTEDKQGGWPGLKLYVIGQGVVAAEVVKGREIDAQDIGAICVVVCREDIAPLVVDTIADVDDFLGVEGAGRQGCGEEEQKQAGPFHIGWMFYLVFLFLG